jgi:hypothetical protein
VAHAGGRNGRFVWKDMAEGIDTQALATGTGF